jgi:hypothetical protein
MENGSNVCINAMPLCIPLTSKLGFAVNLGIYLARDSNRQVFISDKVNLKAYQAVFVRALGPAYRKA